MIYLLILIGVVATEFLFGESTDTLDETKLDSKGQRYAEAYDYVSSAPEIS